MSAAGAPSRPASSPTARGEPASALAAARARPGVTAALLAAAGAAWWWTVERMAGMDAGPGTGLGTLGWFTGAWTAMMAAMMLPSLAPAAAAHAAWTRRRGLGRPLLFACGYMLVWGAAGVAAYALFALGGDLLGPELAWRAGGRWLAGGVIAVAALYELTPLKHSCLLRCASPRRLLRGTSRDGHAGALAMGVRNGLSCVGCSWALMAALFALGVMSLTWMALVAALVALEKALPARRAVAAAIAVLLAVLALAVVGAPRHVPGLVVPGGAGGGATRAMGHR